MINKFVFVAVILAIALLAGCAQRSGQGLQQSIAAPQPVVPPAAPRSTAASEKCPPRDGLEAGLSGNRVNFNCDRWAVPEYFKGYDLGERMYKLKERRRLAVQNVTQAQYIWERLREDLRRAPADSRRAEILRGEVAVAAQDVEKKKFKVRRVDARISPVESDIRSFKYRHW